MNNIERYYILYKFANLKSLVKTDIIASYSTLLGEKVALRYARDALKSSRNGILAEQYFDGYIRRVGGG